MVTRADDRNGTRPNETKENTMSDSMYLNPGDMIVCETLGVCELLKKFSQERLRNLIVRDATGELYEIDSALVSGTLPSVPANLRRSLLQNQN
jgi:hypothetical protein